MKVSVAVLNKHGKNAVSQVLDLLHSFDDGQISHFGVVSPTKSLLEKDLSIINKQGVESSVLFGYISSRPTSASNFDFLQLDDASLIFQGRIYAPLPKNSIADQLTKEPQHCETILRTLIEQADGDYAFWNLKNDSIASGRDPIGVQPLYYGENRDIVAFATNRKALWKLGIEKPESFPPGSLAFANEDGFKFMPIKNLAYTKPKSITFESAAENLQILLEQAIMRRVHGLKEVAVAFSGGLDSSVVAFLAKKIGAKVNLLHVSLENQPETEEAIKIAETLDLPLQVHLFKDSDVETALPKVLELIEEPDPVKVSIGVPFFWTGKKAAEEGFKVLLAGQGADELFGGYQRYVDECLNGGAEKVRRTMFSDVVDIHESNLERDLKIIDFFDVELRLPFASFDIAEFALSLPLECKIENKPDTLRKLVLRKVAQNLGLSSIISEKPKKAVQYSTGINNALKRIAKKNDKTVNEYIKEMFEKQKALFIARR
jgi:asparagine synthase (glutamine-hydrolysing)